MNSSADLLSERTLCVTSLEHSIWLDLHAGLEHALARLELAHLSAPSMLLLHDLVERAVTAMQRQMFLQLAEADFGIDPAGNAGYLDNLFQSEVTEHGSQNIARHCKENGVNVAISFPQDAGAIISIKAPTAWNWIDGNTGRLMEALGYQWQEDAPDDGAECTVLTISKQPGDASRHDAAALLDEAASLTPLQRIYARLGYGLIQFSSAGEIVAMSESMLASARLPAGAASIATLSAAIPFNFYNDIIWGLALTDGGGEFENYRTRLRFGGEQKRSILFNVSGYRDEEGNIHSLWQTVSLEEGGANLSEGSILNEVRVHKITRNYVPQLVEEKAREAVRLGRDKLTNEQCAVAVLFCDIVGFTSYVESNASSESIINTLNTILRRVSSSVRRYNGHIDKFMGDSVMAIFRDPASAVLAALDMQSHSADINGLRSRAGQELLRLRIGIHWGEVVIGNVGTAERLDWTAIGDVVNTASRIEKNCNPGSILISQSLRDAIAPVQQEQIEFGESFRITVKGKRDAVAVCHVASHKENLPD